MRGALISTPTDTVLLLTKTNQTLSLPPSLHAAVLTSVPAGPPDAIIGLTDAYNSSTAPHKVNVGVGAYRDDSGKPYVLPVVKEAEARVVEKGERERVSA